MEVHEDEFSKTAFITPFEKFAHKRIPMGLCNPPKYSHNLIVSLLAKVKNTTVFLYDILIATKSAEEHVSPLREILDIFAEKTIICPKQIYSQGFTIKKDWYTPISED